MNRLRIILATNTTLHEMFIGIIAANVVLAFVSMVFTTDRMSAGIGVLIGTLVAIIYSTHMAVTVDDALCLDEKGAAGQMRKHMLIRYTYVCVIVGASCYFKIANPVCIVLACLMVKAGAYLQPIVHRILNRSDYHEQSESENGGKISE